MSGDAATFVWTHVLGAIISFPIGVILGLILKKTVWRKIFWLKKWVFNEILTIDLLAVKEYPYSLTTDIDISLFQQIKSRITEAKLVQHSSDTMIVNVSPIFGNLVLRKNEVADEGGEDEEGFTPSVRLTISTENSVRIGIREIKEQLSDYERYVNSIFDSISITLFSKSNILPRQSFVECDIIRPIIFVEKKHINLHDKNLDAEVNGTDDKLTIISPINNITKATKKYHFI